MSSREQNDRECFAKVVVLHGQDLSVGASAPANTFSIISCEPQHLNMRSNDERPPLRRSPNRRRLRRRSGHADEGMWTFDNFPSAAVAKQHGVDIGPAWLERVRLSVVRLAGCTASFVSDRGLMLTNHHCVEGCLAQHSTRDKSLIETGVFAQSRDEELRCATQIADVLVELEDITPLVAIATRELNDWQAKERRRQTLTTLEQTLRRYFTNISQPIEM